MNLTDFEFFQGLANAFDVVSGKDLLETAPGSPIPAGAYVAGVMSDHHKTFLAVVRLLKRGAQAAEKAHEEDPEEVPLGELYTLGAQCTIVEQNFWHVVQTEFPPPVEYRVRGFTCGYGPNFEVYYLILPEETDVPTLEPSANAFIVEQPDVGYVN